MDVSAVSRYARTHRRLGVTFVLALASACVTPSQLRTVVSNAVPVGTVSSYAGALNQLPDGWMFADGRSLSVSDYPELFRVIGTHWGGSGTTTFALPDLRGRFVRGVDSTAGHDPDRDARTATASGGSIGNTVGSIQGAATAMPLSPFVADPVGDHQHNVDLELSAGRCCTNNHNTVANPNIHGETHLTSPAGGHTHAIRGGDRETRPVNAYAYWIIRVR
jgi:microcystin-dependent protein